MNLNAASSTIALRATVPLPVPEGSIILKEPSTAAGTKNFGQARLSPTGCSISTE